MLLRDQMTKLEPHITETLDGKLELHFTEYFDGETIAVSNDGRQILEVEQLKTDMRTSLARIAHIDVPSQRVELTFEVVSKGIRASSTLEPAALKFVVVELADAKLELKPVSIEDYKREPRGYA